MKKNLIILLIFVAIGILFYKSYQYWQTPEEIILEEKEEEVTESPKSQKDPIILKCEDGTLYNQCSSVKPFYCQDGKLVNLCSVCGCDSEIKVCTANEACKQTQAYKIPILVLKYFPIKDGLLNPDITGINNDITTIRTKVNNLTAQTIDSLEKGSIYHGYKDPSAKPSLDYSVFETKEFLSAIPLSSEFIPFADHIQILNELNICDYVDNKGIKEVWIWMYHHNETVPIESNMAMGKSSSAFWNRSTYGDISNSYRQLDLPVCQKTYTVYDYNYSRGVAEAVENHTHQMEAMFNYVDRRETTPQDQWSSLLFWGNFVGSDITHKIVDPGCGWTHYPPNGKSDYDWRNEEYIWSDCENWKPDGSGEKKQINCQSWAGSTCNDDGGLAFKIWWTQNIPGMNNNLYSEGQKLKNWWSFIGDFDQTVQSRKSLTY